MYNKYGTDKYSLNEFMHVHLNLRKIFLQQRFCYVMMFCSVLYIYIVDFK